MRAEYLGFNNKTCSAGVPPESKVYGDTVGPLLRNYFDSKQWKTWDMDVLSSNATSAVVTLMNYYTGKGVRETKCKDYYMADYYDKKGACSDDPWAERVHLHKEAQEWTLSPVPTRDECFYIVNNNKPEGCWRYLSARNDCNDPYVRLAAGDDGSGNQRWKLVRVDPSPPPSPSPSPSPSPVPFSPAPSAIPGPTIQTTSDTAPGGVVVVLVESFGGNTECRVRNVQFTFTPSSAPWAAQVVEVGAIPSLQTSGLREVLSQSGIYTIQAVGKCSDGRSTPGSNIVEVNSVPQTPESTISLLGVNYPEGSATKYTSDIAGDFVTISTGLWPAPVYIGVSLSGTSAALLEEESGRIDKGGILRYASSITDESTFVSLNGASGGFTGASLCGSNLAAVNAQNNTLYYTNDPTQDLSEVSDAPAFLAQVSLSGTSALVRTTGGDLKYTASITSGDWLDITFPVISPFLADIMMSGKAAAVLEETGEVWYTSDVSVASPFWTLVTLPTLSDSTAKVTHLSLFQGRIALTTSESVKDDSNIWYATNIEAPEWENLAGWLSDVSLSD